MLLYNDDYFAGIGLHLLFRFFDSLLQSMFFFEGGLVIHFSKTLSNYNEYALPYILTHVLFKTNQANKINNKLSHPSQTLIYFFSNKIYLLLMHNLLESRRTALGHESPVKL